MKTNNIFKKLLRSLRIYFATNKLFFSYVVLSIIITTLLRVITISNFWDLKPFLVDLTIIIIMGSFGYLIKPKRQFVYFFALLCLHTTACIVNAVYFTFYMSFTTFSLLSSLGQAGEVADSVAEKLNITHFMFLAAPIIFIYINSRLSSKNYFSFVSKVEKSKKMFLNTILVSCIFLILAAIGTSNTQLSRLAKQWNREYTVQKFGIILYQANDFVQSLSPQLNTLFGYDEAARNFRDYYNNQKQDYQINSYTNVFEGKNIIFVHLESIQSFVLDLKINNQEITPNLNQLTKEGLYFSNFYPQIGVGTSSDTEFTLNTSLMPALSGTVFVSYADRTYETMPLLLKDKGYYTFSMHGNKAAMWNRDVMHKKLGYDDFYSKSSYVIDEEVGLGLSDMSFFRQIVPMLEQIESNNSNYMGTVITLSNHSPFDDLEKYGEFDLTNKIDIYDEKTNQYQTVIDNALDTSKMGNYLKSTHYADKALGYFLELIKNSFYFNNTVFVFYGDHDARLSKAEFNYLYNYDAKTGEFILEDNPNYYDYNYYLQQLNKKTPLIIYTKDNAYINEYDYPMGMIDVLPTLANMFNFKCTYCLGNDIFDIGYNNRIVFPNGNVLTNRLYYNNAKSEYVVLNNEPIDANYIDSLKEYATKTLTLSDNIIVHDLIVKESSNLESEKK